MAGQSNFAFIEDEWPQIYQSSLRAEEYIRTDPRAACFHARYATEQLIQHAYTWARLPEPYRDDLAAHIHADAFVQRAGQTIVQKLNLIRKVGNQAVHSHNQIRSDVALQVLRDLHYVMLWGAQHYSSAPHKVPAAATFNTEIAARRQPMHYEDLQKLAVKVQKEQQDYKKQLEESAAKNAELEAELEKLRAAHAEAARTAQAQQAAQTFEQRDTDEAGTRLKLIDVDLQAAGWRLDGPETTTPDATREHRVTGMPDATGTRTGTGYIDYVLWSDDGLPLAVVEAKRTLRKAEAGQEQAKLYADAMERDYGQRPLIFYTNGYRTMLWDDAAFGDKGYPPRRIDGFLTKANLQWRIRSRTARTSLAETPISGTIAGRPYQERMIRSVGQQFAQMRRRSLLVMATGTGKTRTVIALADQMMRAGWAKRVLFLADRVALVNQAVDAFRQHLPDAPPINLMTEKTTDGRVFVSTYPTMMNLLKPESRMFGPGFFDLVIVDEAHRSIYASYKSLFDYFDAHLVGLTATPVEDVHRSTFEFFGQENGVPTDTYPLEEAIAEKWLVPYIPRAAETQFLSHGMRYEEMSEEDREQWETVEWTDPGTDDAGLIPEVVRKQDMNRKVINKDTNNKVLATLMEEGIHVAGGDRLGKTIIFAQNQEHAYALYESFTEQYPHLGGSFARVITHEVERVQELIRDFSKRDSEPHIAITVDMLDTGIDVPSVVNLVFFKTVYSKAKFWQMVGRGTRLSENLFGPGQDKENFLILDFGDNFAFFDEEREEKPRPRQKSLSERLFESRLRLLNSLDEGPGEALSEDQRKTLRENVLDRTLKHLRGMNPDYIQVRPHRDLLVQYTPREKWRHVSAEEVQHLSQTFGPLPSASAQEKEEAKSFDYTILQAQTAQVEGDAELFAAQRDKIQDVAEDLLTRRSIPAVDQHASLLHDLTDEAWWDGANCVRLERVRTSLRNIVHYVEPRTWKPVHTNFEDTDVTVADASLRHTTPATDMARFRQKAEQFLQKHLNHVALQRVRFNRQLTAQDIEVLQEMLVDSGVGTREDVEAAAQEAEGLGLFIRRIVGVDKSVAKEAFEKFIQNANFSAEQLRFIELIVDYVSVNGTMKAASLYQSPFTDYAPNGPDEVLGEDRVDTVVTILEDFRERALAA
ncbi:DEAD/DEAH box helicase family protein [Nesterenkonia sp. NBAIMH1]|uniref:DEAD/DEAH box helicase family protein n=1 Tax=Nesterenkonia sp. NBAIMH1 TaxID=2600320 RepID=UPI0011B4E48E|nr:DEAD/DEAH box helicase family protein [Nesterenkonia sp. NBAIMH1]